MVRVVPAGVKVCMPHNNAATLSQLEQGMAADLCVMYSSLLLHADSGNSLCCAACPVIACRFPVQELLMQLLGLEDAPSGQLHSCVATPVRA